MTQQIILSCPFTGDPVEIEDAAIKWAQFSDCNNGHIIENKIVTKDYLLKALCFSLVGRRGIQKGETEQDVIKKWNQRAAPVMGDNGIMNCPFCGKPCNYAAPIFAPVIIISCENYEWESTCCNPSIQYYCYEPKEKFTALKKAIEIWNTRFYPNNPINPTP